MNQLHNTSKESLKVYLRYQLEVLSLNNRLPSTYEEKIYKYKTTAKKETYQIDDLYKCLISKAWNLGVRTRVYMFRNKYYHLEFIGTYEGYQQYLQEKL